jgi:hypothetical protein
LICLEETENKLNPTILKLNFVNFESISALTKSLDERDFSLINFMGYNFILDLEGIIIFIQNIGYFQNFLKIYGIVPELEYGFSNRFIRVRNLSFIGGKSLTIVRNTMENLNVSFEASSFKTVEVFEINILSTSIQFVDCTFLMGIEEQSLQRIAAKYFISTNNTNITLENSSFSGDYSISNENYQFFISERSQALFLNLNIKNIKISEVSDRKRG